MSKNSKKVVISGYYGYDNCGDEAVLLSIISSLRSLRSDLDIVVFSGNPAKTRQLYDVDAVNRWNPISIVLSLLSCSLLISGGGSLLQDQTSTKSLRYYLSIINLATLFRKKVMIYAQGIGPLNFGKSRTMVAKAINRCQSVTVRDAASASLLTSIGVTKKVEITADPVLMLTHDMLTQDAPSQGAHSQDAPSQGAPTQDAPPNDKTSSFGILEELEHMGLSRNGKKPLLLAIMRSWGDNRHIPAVAEFLDSQIKSGYNVLLVPAHHPDDMNTNNMIRSSMSKQPHTIDKCLTAREFIALTAHADLVFSMRLHGLICAFASDTPIFALSYDPKVDAFMEQAGLIEYCIALERFNAKTAEVLMLMQESEISTVLEYQVSQRKAMQEQAIKTTKMAIELLD